MEDITHFLPLILGNGGAKSYYFVILMDKMDKSGINGDVINQIPTGIFQAFFIIVALAQGQG
jgi:hypothetical protein